MDGIDFDDVLKRLKFVSNLLVSKRLCIKTIVTVSAVAQPLIMAISAPLSRSFLPRGYRLALLLLLFRLKGALLLVSAMRQYQVVPSAVFTEQAELWEKTYECKELICVWVANVYIISALHDSHVKLIANICRELVP